LQATSSSQTRLIVRPLPITIGCTKLAAASYLTPSGNTTESQALLRAVSIDEVYALEELFKELSNRLHKVH